MVMEPAIGILVGVVILCVVMVGLVYLCDRNENAN